MAQLESLDLISKTKSLISALNLVSRDLPLPTDLFDVVSSIYDTAHDANLDDGQGLVWFLTYPLSFFCVLSVGFRFRGRYLGFGTWVLVNLGSWVGFGTEIGGPGPFQFWISVKFSNFVKLCKKELYFYAYLSVSS